MKILKKCVLGASTLGIALSLAACNNQESSQSGNVEETVKKYNNAKETER